MAGSRKLVALFVAVGGLLALPAGAGAEILYDQTDHAAAATADSTGPNFAPSNFFNPGSEDRTADDFTVPEGETWTLSEVAVGGAYSNPGADETVNVFVYADDGGEPGTEVFSQLGIVAPGPDYDVALSGVPALAAGTYWITVQQADASFAYWSWQTRTVQSGNAAQWRTVGGAPPGCDSVAWHLRTVCWPGPSPDQVFQLQGTKTEPPVVVEPKVTLGKLEKNKKRGTARQPAFVNVPGTVALSGKNVATKSKSAAAESTVTLKVKPKGKTLEKLESQGHARTKVAVTFTPDAGAADSVKRLIELRLKG